MESVYVLWNSINYVDPSGHDVVAIPAGYYVASAVVSFAASIVVTRDVYNVVTGKEKKSIRKNYPKLNQKVKQRIK